MGQLSSKLEDKQGLSDPDLVLSSFGAHVFFMADRSHLNLTVKAFERVLLQHVYELHVLFQLVSFSFDIQSARPVLDQILNVLLSNLQNALQLPRVLELDIPDLSFEKRKELLIPCDHLHFLLRGPITMSEHSNDRA